MILDKERGYKLYPLTVDIESIKDYGIGLTVFLDFLNKLILFFFLMSLCATVVLYSNYNGNGVNTIFNISFSLSG